MDEYTFKPYNCSDCSLEILDESNACPFDERCQECDMIRDQENSSEIDALAKQFELDYPGQPFYADNE